MVLIHLHGIIQEQGNIILGERAAIWLVSILARYIFLLVYRLNTLSVMCQDDVGVAKYIPVCDHLYINTCTATNFCVLITIGTWYIYT